MKGKQLHLEAKKQLLKYLDEAYASNPGGITIQGHEIGFYDNNDISADGINRRSILADVITQLKKDEIIKYSSPDNMRPITDLKLTPKGLTRPRNPIEAFKEEGIKSSIGAFLNALGRYLVKKFE